MGSKGRKGEGLNCVRERDTHTQRVKENRERGGGKREERGKIEDGEKSKRGKEEGKFVLERDRGSKRKERKRQRGGKGNGDKGGDGEESKGKQGDVVNLC